MLQIYYHLDAATFPSELYRVRQEVDEHLLKAVCVVVDCRQLGLVLGLDEDDNINIFLVGHERQRLTGLLGLFQEVEELICSLEAAVFSLGGVQKVVDQVQEDGTAAVAGRCQLCNGLLMQNKSSNSLS